MGTKEIKIVPPEGYEIDKENSTFECVKFKPIDKRWRDGNPLINGWYLDDDEIKSYNLHGHGLSKWKNGNLSVFATKKQAKSAFAMAQISQIMANDERFGGPVTDEEWKNSTSKYIISRSYDGVLSSVAASMYFFLAFHTQEQRDLFLDENEDLVKDYLMIG